MFWKSLVDVCADDAAPDGAWEFFARWFYKDATPTGLGPAEGRKPLLFSVAVGEGES